MNKTFGGHMNIVEPESSRSSWTIAAYWSMSVAALVAPILFWVGFANGTGHADVYAHLHDDSYSLMAATSWLPFVLLGLFGEVLGFNRGWWRNWLKFGRTSQTQERWLFFVEFAILIALLFCAAWSGTTMGQVWAVRSGVEALLITAGLVVMLTSLYVLVVFPEVTSPVQILKPSPIEVPAISDHHEAEELPEQPLQPNHAVAKREQEDSYEFEWQRPTLGFNSLSGMEDLKDQLRDAIKGFQHYREFGSFQGADRNPDDSLRIMKIGDISDTNGILLSGPPGSGKTAFAFAIAAELGLPFVKIGCADITSKWVNQSPSMVKELFRQAAQNQPCVVFLDEFDGVAMSRSNSQMHGEDRKLVNTLLAQIDDARKKGIVLIAASNFPELIDPAICRDGRFDYRIDIGYPDLPARTAILHSLLEKYQIIAERKVVDQVAALSERRSVAFLEATAKRVRDIVTQRDGFKAFMEDFKVAARAASRKASALPGAGPKLSDIYLNQQVRDYSQSLLYRLRNWEQISASGGEPPRGVLLYGPPGTGKSLYVSSLARELTDWHIFEVNGNDASRDPKVFRDVVELAQTHRPAIVFIDECDELMACRGTGWNASACNEILKAMDGLIAKVPEVIFMAATNRLDEIDPAALRGGRFDEQVFMDILRGGDLVAFLESQLQSLKSRRITVNVDVFKLANELQEASPADIVSLVRRAVNASLGQPGCKQTITLEHFECAMRLQKRELF
jgi:transitional endoplasmic reticulum ATPase